MAYTFNLGFASLLGVQIVTPPTKTQYEEGETIDVTGMVVALAYSDGYLKVTSDYTYTPQTASLGDTEITVSVWTSRGFLTATTPITVGSETRLQVPEYIGDLYYFFGRRRIVDYPILWSNYDPNALTMNGIKAAEEVGTYTATFTPKSGYTWEDGTTATKNASWSIRQPTVGEMIEPEGGQEFTYLDQELIVNLGTDDTAFSAVITQPPTGFQVDLVTYRGIGGVNHVNIICWSPTGIFGIPPQGTFQIRFNSSATTNCPAMRYQTLTYTVNVAQS